MRLSRRREKRGRLSVALIDGYEIGATFSSSRSSLKKNAAL